MQQLTIFYVFFSNPGELFLGGTVSGLLLDFECESRYLLEVQVTDSSGLTDISNIEVVVEDVNDLTVSGFIYPSGQSGVGTLGGDVVVIAGRF
jgi:hypothetical protein